MRSYLLLLLTLFPACGSTPVAAKPDVQPPTPAPRLVVENSAAKESAPAAVAQDTSAGESAQNGTDAETQSEEGAGATPAAGQASGVGATPSTGRREERLPMGWIAGKPLYAEDLLREWYQLASREFELVVDKMVASQLAYAEASRLGLRLSEEAVELRVDGERKRLQADLAARGDERTLEEVIQAESGQSPEAYFARLRSASIQQMIVERTVRAWTLANESRGVRVIVVPVEELTGVEEALAGGADFAALAKEKSIDDSAVDGGWVPFVVEQTASPLARAAFLAEVGTTTGPIEVGEHRVLVRVEKHRDAREGAWDAVGGHVDASLALEPVRDSEYVLWKLTMERRYPIDLRPLEELIRPN